MPESFFVDPDASTATTTAPSVPRLGHLERRCNSCGVDWDLRWSACPKCHGQVFDEIVVPPSLFQRIGDKIMGVATPEPPKVKPLDPGVVEVFEHCARVGREWAAALQAASDVARRAVNETPSASMSYLQDKLHAVAVTAGDFSSSALTSSQILPTLAIERLINDMVAQHATEVTT